MRICPNAKFIKFFALRFHYFEDPFCKFFALNLLFQDTSYSLALTYSSFLLIFGSKSVKFAQKYCTFLKFLTLEQRFPIGDARTPWRSEKRFLGVRKKLANFTADEQYR